MDAPLYQELPVIEYHEVRDFRLHTILNELSKKELMTMSKCFKINHVSHKKRGELQNIIESDLNLYLKQFLYLMNDHHLELLNQLLSDEFIPVNESEPINPNLYFLMCYGFLYPIKYQEVSGVILPKEIRKLIIPLLTPKMMEIFDRNNNIIKIANDYIQYHGLIEYQMINYLYQQKYPKENFVHELKDIIELEGQFSNMFIVEEEYLFLPQLKPTLFKFLEKRKLVERMDYYNYNLNTRDVLALQDQVVIQKLRKSLKQLTIDEQNDILRKSLDKLNYGHTLEQVKDSLWAEMPNKARIKYFKQLEKHEAELHLWVYKGHRKVDIH